MSPLPTDEIYEKYLQRAITEINDLGAELARTGGERTPVLPSGHPLADVFLLKYGPQHAELQEGVAFYGRTGQAILKSLQRLRVDPIAIYGTNCLKFATDNDEDEARGWVRRELHIVQPKLLVVMGEDALGFVNGLEFPLSDRLEAREGELQRFTASIDALYAPDVDASLDEQDAKTRFWNAFKAVGPWWAELPPY